MKAKKLRIITEILAIIVICLVSFVGVYKQNTNKMENQVKGYELSNDLAGYREIMFQISDATEVLDKDGKVVGSTDDYSDSTIENYSYTKTDTKVNPDEVYTTENYQTAKSMIEDRLKKLGVMQYNISLDKQTGTIYVQIPENDDTDHTISNVLQVANFEMKDSKDNSQVFLTNKDIKNVEAVYNTTNGTTVYLQLQFNKNGTQILKELSTGEYAKKEDANDENSNKTDNQTEDGNAVEAEVNVSSTEDTQEENNDNAEQNNSEEESNTTQKEITIYIDNNEMITTSFDTPIEDGIINLSMSKATTDQEAISESLKSASTIALLLNSGKMPITYKVETNQYVATDIQAETIKCVLYAIVAAVLIALAILIVKFRLKGLIAAISYIGFIAIYLLLVRYTNVVVSIESIVSGVIVAIINYVVTYRLIKIIEKDEQIRKKVYIQDFKKSILTVLPVFMIAIIFTFINWTPISTFGMFLFWGILFSMVYNYILTIDMVD